MMDCDGGDDPEGENSCGIQSLEKACEILRNYLSDNSGNLQKDLIDAGKNMIKIVELI